MAAVLYRPLRYTLLRCEIAFAFETFLLEREVAYIDGCKMNERYSVEAVFNVDDE